MATERNPFDRIEKELANVVPMNPVSMDEEQEATFELEPDGGVTVDFSTTIVIDIFCNLTKFIII